MAGLAHPATRANHNSGVSFLVDLEFGHHLTHGLCLTVQFFRRGCRLLGAGSRFTRDRRNVFHVLGDLLRRRRLLFGSCRYLLNHVLHLLGHAHDRGQAVAGLVGQFATLIDLLNTGFH